MAEDNLTARLPQRLQVGDPISKQRYLDPVVENILQLRSVITPPQQINEGVSPDEEADLKFEFMTIVSEGADVINCLDTQGTAAIVAKPDHLRGYIATRTVSGENQIIIKPYEAGLRILTARGITGAGETEELIDMNWQARAWAKAFEG